MPEILKTKRMTEGDYDKATPAGKRFLETADEHREDVIGRFNLRMGRGSSIRVAHPHTRLVRRNGKWVWIDMRK